MNERIIVFDTETTGLEPSEGSRIVEIGALEMIDFRLTGEEFHCYINPETPMPQAAFNVHGLSDDFLAKKPIFAKIIPEFLIFIGDAALLAHNASFDLNFLQYQLQMIGSAPLKNQIIDSLLLARRKFPNQKNDLNSLATRLNIDISMREKHGALLDSQILAQIYIALEGKQQSNLLEETQQLAANEKMTDLAMPSAQPQADRHYLTIMPTRFETEQHQILRQKLGAKSLWKL